MSLPSAATKVHLDSAADDPSQARAELADLIDKFNDLRTHLLLSAITSTPYPVGVGLAALSSTLALDASYLASFRAGMAVNNNVTDANNDIDFGVGLAIDSTNARLIKRATAITKRLDASWAVGTNQGGLDTGAKASSTGYYLWDIMRSDTGIVDALFSLSGTAPTMPANYDYKALNGWVLTDGSGNIRAFTRRGSKTLWTTQIQDQVAASIGTSESLFALSVPGALRVVPLWRAEGVNAGSVWRLLITGPDEADVAPTTGRSSAIAGAGTSAALNWTPCTCDTSGRLRARATVAATQLDLWTYGWEDPRPRFEL